MDYDVITIDTNIFQNQSFIFNRGILAQLQQFKGRAGQFVLSEIVLKELLKHTAEDSQKAKDLLIRAVRDIPNSSVLDFANIDLLNRVCATSIDGKDAAKNKINQFQEDTGFIVIPAQLADIQDLVESYFESKPPFEVNGKKKHEFPDAIALLSLEKWALDNNKKILAISDDTGWFEYAQQSHQIDVEKDLAKALQSFQEHADVTEKLILSMLQNISTGGLCELNRQMSDGIDHAVSTLNFDADGHSPFIFELAEMDIEYNDFRFLNKDGKYDLSLVQIGKDKTTFRTKLEVDIKAIATFQLSVWDSMDEDYVTMGEETIEKDFTLLVDALILVEGDLTTDNLEESLSITSVELFNVDTILQFDLIDWNDYESYEE